MKGFVQLLIGTFCWGIVYAQPAGQVQGTIRDARTLVPLAGITVRTGQGNFSAVSDAGGRYLLQQVKTGSYSIEAGGVGYRTARQFDVPVTTGNTIELNFELEPESKELESVSIRSYASKPAGTVNSVQRLGITEIAKYPGANFDIAKVVQSLPGVSGSVGFRNDIIIRGGAPNEVVYFLDGIEIPSINHFATQGAAGGPVGLLNVSFIEGVTLHTSGFPSKYENPLSGVLQFKQKSGNPDRFQGNFRLSASEAALTAEGPLGKKGGNTTYMVSARRSYLQLIFKLIDLPFLPDYWDYQYKITHKAGKKDEINFIGIGAIDNFSFRRPNNPTLEQLAILDQIPLNSQRTNTVGVSWRHSLDKGFWQLALSNSRLVNSADQFTNNEKPSDTTRILGYRSVEDETRLRWEWNKTVNGWQLQAGSTGTLVNYENTTFQRRTGYTANYAAESRFFRYGANFSVGRKFAQDRLFVTVGVRADGNTLMDTGNEFWRTFSPRLGWSYRITQQLSFNGSLGRYFKIPPYTILGFQENGVAVNQSTRYIQSDHAVAGLEYQPTSAVRVTLEGFYKKYSNYPVSLDKGISLANLGGDFGVLGNERVISTGKGRTYGFEFMYQQRLTKRFYGILAYTFYYSQFTGVDNRYVASSWDNRHLLSFTGGYKFPRNWEVGLRFRYLGGAPYTPFNITQSLEDYPFINNGVPDYSRLNSQRLQGFHAADLRIDKKWNFKKWTLDLFLDIQNAYNSDNQAPPGFTLERNADNSIATRTGQPYQPGKFQDPSVPNNRQDAVPAILPNNSGSLLPSMGFVIEF